MTVMFLPGLLCDARLWQFQLPHCDGAQVADLTQDESLPAMAARVLRQAPPRFAIAALSMGGYVAFEILRQAPQRVSHLALFATAARAEEPEAARRRRGLMMLARHHRFLGVTPRQLPNILHERNLRNRDLCDLVMRMSVEVGREAFLRQQTAILNRPDSRDVLPGIRIPTLVAAGEADRTIPPSVTGEIAALIPGARLVRFAGSGHLPPLEQPELATACLRELLAAA